MNSIAIEFEDGVRHCVSRYAVRKAEPERQLSLFGKRLEAERCATWDRELP